MAFGRQALCGVDARLHRAQYRRVRYGTVIHRDAIHDGDRVDESLFLDEPDHVLVCGNDLGAAGVVIQDVGTIAEPVLHFGADDRSDLLRRPGGASTATPARGLGRIVEDFDGDLVLGH